MGCSVSSIEKESNTISSDAQREQAKVSPSKAQEQQECIVVSHSELPLDDCTENGGSNNSFPLLNNVLDNAKSSRPPSSKSKQSIRSHRSNNADSITGSSFPPEKPTSAHSNNSRTLSNSIKNRSLKSPSASLKLESNRPTLNDDDLHNDTNVEMEAKTTCSSETFTVVKEDEVLETEVSTATNLNYLISDMKESEENGDSDQAQGLKESLNRELPSPSEKYRPETPFVESNNENHSEDEGIGFEKLDTISIQEEKNVTFENAYQLLGNSILQNSYWEDLGINIDAPSAKNSKENDAPIIDDVPEVQLMLPNANEEKEVKDESGNENNEELLTQDSTSTKELRIDIHVSEEVLQQSEAGEPKEAAYDNEALLPPWMEKQENKSQNNNDDSAISLSDLLSDLDSSEDAPCSLAASSSGLVLHRPTTSKPREDISNSDFLNIPNITSENEASKYIDTIKIDAINEINKNTDKDNTDENSVDEAETVTEEQHNVVLEVVEEGLSSFVNAMEQSNQSKKQNNEGGNEIDLVAVEGEDTKNDLETQSVQNNETQDDAFNNEDILPVELNNEILMANNKEEASLETADENLLVLPKENNEIESIDPQNEHKASDVHSCLDDNIESLEQDTAIEELQQNERESLSSQRELGTGEEQPPENNNNNDDAGIKNNEDSQIIDNKAKALLKRQNTAALNDQGDDGQTIQEQDPPNVNGNVNGLQESQIVETKYENDSHNDLECNTEIQINELSKEEECLFEWSSEDERIERMLKNRNEPHEKNYEIQKESDSLNEESNSLQDDERDQLQEDSHDLPADKDDFQNVNNEIQTESSQLQNESYDFQLESDQLLEKNYDIKEADNELHKESSESEKETEKKQIEHTQLTLLPEGVINEPDNEGNSTDGAIDNFIESRIKETNLIEQIEEKIDELLNNSKINSEISETAAGANEKIQKIIRFVLPDDPNEDNEPINTNITSSELTFKESNRKAHDHTADSRHGQGGETCANPPEGDEAIREKMTLDLSREVSFKGCKLGDKSDDDTADDKVNSLNISKQTLRSEEDHLRASSRQSVASMTLKLSDISNLSVMEIKQIGRITSQKSSSNIDTDITESERYQPVIGF